MIRLPHSIPAILLVLASAWLQAAPPPAGAGRMLQQLESESWIQQAEALHYLGEHRVELATDAVRSLLNSNTAHPWIRGRALVSLSQIEDKSTQVNSASGSPMT